MGDLVSVWCDPMGADRFASGRFEGLVVDSRFLLGLTNGHYKTPE